MVAEGQAVKPGDIHAFLTLAEESALEQARRADELLARGEAGPLTVITSYSIHYTKLYDGRLSNERL